MPGIIPSSNSAFRVVKSITPVMEKPIVQPPSNPHGFAWRKYTEAQIRGSLCSDIQKRNMVILAIQNLADELKTIKVINSIEKYRRYITLQKHHDALVEQLKVLKNKLDIHGEYQLYCHYKH